MAESSAASTEIRVDLHTHSVHSDGVLTPTDLVQRAAARGVSLLALTDHDTLAAYRKRRSRLPQREFALCVASRYLGATATKRSRSRFGGRGIAPELEAHAARVAQQRRDRIAEMGARLTKRSQLPGTDLAQTVLAETQSPTRLHMARALVAGGHAKDLEEAFERWLNRGQPGHVPIEWPSLAETMAALRSAAPVIALAHPHRYRLSAGGLRELAISFKDEGGTGLEASVAGMGPNDADRIASLCRKFDLDASIGSDFHDPAIPWNPLGRWLKLPDGLRPITARL